MEEYMKIKLSVYFCTFLTKIVYTACFILLNSCVKVFFTPKMHS